ncbi:class I SAM-dependent methyltransferase [Leeuwenhoekiella sp. NPDC079379]|uniref:class I SAM-dependent methyltransferase n=1 Tax=Leeuwenhoekiella sp. NPDC079379 TaxID=3364122 RepID=UPI0037C53041
MNKRILDPDVSEFIKANLKEDVSRLILNGSPFPDVSVQELAQQLLGLQKAQTKLPTWAETAGIYFPPKLSLEQTSSELTAQYKASLVNGAKLIDLTGGFGIDDFYLSNQFTHVTHCELNDDLAVIAAHNYDKLNISNVEVVTLNSLEYLENSIDQYDVIYADPSRRSDSKGKVFMLKDCEPNIPEALPFLFTKSKTILIKTSPLLDISAGLKELRNVTEVHAVALKNEVKELLWVLKQDTTNEPVKLICVNLESSYTQPVHLNAHSLGDAIANFGEPATFLYEPNAAIMKLGAFNWVSAHYNLDKLAPNSHLYTSKNKIDFPGRVFKVDAVIPYSKKEISKQIKNIKAHITTRNFKETSAALRAKFKVKDGGDTYLFFTTLLNNKTCMLKCSKIED